MVWKGIPFRSTGLGGLRRVGALLLLTLVQGCEGVSGPSGPPEIQEIPQDFAAGQRIVIHGSGLADASVWIDGLPARVIARRQASVEVEVPQGLPECRSPLPEVDVNVMAQGWDTTVARRTWGSPVGVDLSPGSHLIHAATFARGCPFSVPPGTYGVAFFRTAASGLSEEDKTVRVGFDLELRTPLSDPSAPVASRGRLAGPFLEWAREPRLGAVLPVPEERIPSVPESPALSSSPAAASCSKPALRAGDTLTLLRKWGGENAELLRTRSASEHFAVVLPMAAESSLSATQLDSADALSDRLESDAYPFVDRAFSVWPDQDGNGQLIVELGDAGTASYSGADGFWPDGCLGDFIQVDTSYLLPNPDVPFRLYTAIVHEITHWIDIGPFLVDQAELPEWSLEGIAKLADQLWREERSGLDFWANHGHEACAIVCLQTVLVGNRYGGTALENPSYINGPNILRYLIQQVADPGGDPVPLLGRALDRVGDMKLLPTFNTLGGTERGEADLQGELLLSLYADDFVPGASPRIQNATWNLPSVNPDAFPAREFVLTEEDGGVSIPLAWPDGIVFELDLAETRLLSLSSPASALALGLVRR